MLPRFVNPHFLSESSVTISRKNIYTENEDGHGQKNVDIDPRLVNHMKELISAVWDFSPDLQQEGRSKKRRKLESSEKSHEEEAITFRLLSTKPPRAILLRPKTPPPPITREPETEDNEAQAALRAERAKATVVDGSSILLDSHKPMPRYGDLKKLKSIKISSMPSLPSLMIIEYSQPPRSTRPPVPVSQLQQHPYNHGSVPVSKLRVATPNCPVTELAPTASTSSKRRRRRKLEKDRPAPAFWRPNPAAGGKCLGYAMGFPCSVEVLRSGNNSFTGYPRDGMRTMTC